MNNVIYDRTFDAACMKRAGEDEWASQILTRLRANNPKYLEQIDIMYQGYLNLPDADYIEYRKNYLLENKKTLKLRFR